MQFFIILFRPFNYLAVQWKKIIVKIFPVKSNRSVTEDELLTYVEEVRQEGGINLQEEKMIQRVIKFDDMTAVEICTPRVDVNAVCENSAAEEIGRVFAESGYSRLPVYHDTSDNITGVILLKDFHLEVINRNRPPKDIIKPVVFAAKTIKISKLLKTLQKKQSHMAVLVDEFGGTLGIVTVEDIIEELVGEIWDEHDDIIEEFKRNSDGSFTVLGTANLPDMVKFINSADNEDIPDTTVGNWVMEISGTLPRTGDQFVWRNLNVKVSQVQRHRVMEVQVTIQ
jgi:CBS domain containing-hemolysin-like protein